MIRYLAHKEIDRQKWDHCINDASNGLVYALTWYLDVVSPGWDALIEDDYKSVFPLTHNRKYGIDYLSQPDFTQQLGIFSSSVISEALVKEYLSITSERFQFIEINLNTTNRFSSPDFKIAERHTYLLNLNDDYKSLHKNFSQNTIRNISKAQKSNISLDFDADENEIIKLFKKNKGKDTGLKPRHYLVLLNIIKEGKKRKAIITVGAKTKDGKLCAGAIFLSGLKKTIFLFSATSAEAKKNGAMRFIINNVIESNAQKDVLLDFEGSMDKNLARFYSSFGSKEAVYLRIKRNSLPKFVRWIKN